MGVPLPPCSPHPPILSSAPCLLCIETRAQKPVLRPEGSSVAPGGRGDVGVPGDSQGGLGRAHAALKRGRKVAAWNCGDTSAPAGCWSAAWKQPAGRCLVSSSSGRLGHVAASRERWGGQLPSAESGCGEPYGELGL